MDHHSARMAVIIQEMVRAEVSGVLFTHDPVRPDGAEIIRIEALQGLGEAVVSGIATGEVTQVRRSDLKPMSQEGSRQPLTREQSEDLCSMALRLEAHFGCAQDIEFAVADGKVHLLQARHLPDRERTVAGGAVRRHRSRKATSRRRRQLRHRAGEGQDRPRGEWV